MSCELMRKLATMFMRRPAIDALGGGGFEPSTPGLLSFA
jgi:hypothetical protein